MSRGSFALIQQVSQSSPLRLRGSYLNFYRRFPGDYARDTTHLTLAEHGAFTLLLDAYYSTEKPIPSTEFACAVCHAHTGAEVKVVKKVLAYFFKKRGKQWVNTRAEEEIRFTEHKRKSAKNSAKHRWDRSEGNANASQNTYRNRTTQHDSRDALQTPDSRLQTAQDHLVAAGVTVQTPEAAAAVQQVFAEIETEPFGPWDFQSIFANAVKNGAKSWVDAMERTIQVCKASGVQVPGRFYSIKHVLEKLDAEQSFKKRPM